MARGSGRLTRHLTTKVLRLCSGGQRMGKQSSNRASYVGHASGSGIGLRRWLPLRELSHRLAVLMRLMTHRQHRPHHGLQLLMSQRTHRPSLPRYRYWTILQLLARKSQPCKSKLRQFARSSMESSRKSIIVLECWVYVYSYLFCDESSSRRFLPSQTCCEISQMIQWAQLHNMLCKCML